MKYRSNLKTAWVFWNKFLIFANRATTNLWNFRVNKFTICHPSITSKMRSRSSTLDKINRMHLAGDSTRWWGLKKTGSMKIKMLSVKIKNLKTSSSFYRRIDCFNIYSQRFLLLINNSYLFTIMWNLDTNTRKT